MKKAGLVLIGCIPFAVGAIMDQIMMDQTAQLPYALIGIVFLFLWGMLSYVLRASFSSTKEVAIWLDLPAFIVWILQVIQLGVLQAYWPNWVGIWTQHFYLPLLNLSSWLGLWAHSLLPIYCIAFALMVGASVLGCKVRAK